MAAATLQEFAEEAGAGGHLRVEHDFGDGFYRLRTSEAERRQAAQDIQCSEHIVLELLRNSRDAHAAHVFVAMSREGGKRLITVIDDGEGVPASMHGHVFEPRVTSKLNTSHKDAWGLHGRGMALYSISVNALTAHIVDSAPGLGCAISVETDTAVLPEKTDQSSFPTFTLGEDHAVNVRGPKNILRTACEFAVESRDTCAVYVGSPAEVVATLLAYGTESLSSIDRIFCRDVSELPLVKRLAAASDPRDLAGLARTIGLSISERTARRVLDAGIGGLSPLLDMIVLASPERRTGKRAGKRRLGGSPVVRLEQHERKALGDAALGVYSDIARRRYLETEVTPEVRVGRDRISISIPIVPES